MLTKMDHLRACFTSGVLAADPAKALRNALSVDGGPDAPVWIIAAGKAAGPMAQAALDTVRGLGTPLAGGVVVSVTADADLTPLPVVTGDHPVPGERSAEAARAIEQVARQVLPGDEVWILISGGASSLLAAAPPGLDQRDLEDAFHALYRAGLDITTMNIVRKRLTRLGAGRLAGLLRQAGTIRQYLISDVPDDRIEAIASGPAVADPTTAAEALEVVRSAGRNLRLPPRVMTWLRAAAAGWYAETPKPGDPGLTRVRSRIIASNRLAREAASQAGHRFGFEVTRYDDALSGEASEVGRALATEMLALPKSGAPRLLVWGGEPTVTLGQRSGRGGRAQELALAAASVLARAERPALLLAGGTDGRDGPTDAAGAIVGADTIARMVAAGVDPRTALEAHDAYTALEAAGALLRTGPTGTNVMDLVLGLVD